ncbi:MAG: hypothetical protein AAF805_00200 [Planctomycetota bacterium]
MNALDALSPCCGSACPAPLFVDFRGMLWGFVRRGGAAYLTRVPDMIEDPGWLDEDGYRRVVHPTLHAVLPDLESGGAAYECVGVAGSKLADLSGLDPRTGARQVVWYQTIWMPKGVPYTADNRGQAKAGIAALQVTDGLSIGRQASEAPELLDSWLVTDRVWDDPEYAITKSADRYTVVGLDRIGWFDKTGSDCVWEFYPLGSPAAVTQTWPNPESRPVTLTGRHVIGFDDHRYPVCLESERQRTFFGDGTIQRLFVEFYMREHTSGNGTKSLPDIDKQFPIVELPVSTRTITRTSELSTEIDDALAEFRLWDFTVYIKQQSLETRRRTYTGYVAVEGSSDLLADGAESIGSGHTPSDLVRMAQQPNQLNGSDFTSGPYTAGQAPPLPATGGQNRPGEYVACFPEAVTQFISFAGDGHLGDTPNHAVQFALSSVAGDHGAAVAGRPAQWAAVCEQSDDETTDPDEPAIVVLGQGYTRPLYNKPTTPVIDDAWEAPGGWDETDVSETFRGQPASEDFLAFGGLVVPVWEYTGSVYRPARFATGRYFDAAGGERKAPLATHGALDQACHTIQTATTTPTQ